MISTFTVELPLSFVLTHLFVCLCYRYTAVGRSFFTPPQPIEIAGRDGRSPLYALNQYIYCNLSNFIVYFGTFSAKTLIIINK